MARTYRRNNYSTVKAYIPNLDEFLERPVFYARYYGGTKPNPKDAIKQMWAFFHADYDWWGTPPAWFRRESERLYRVRNRQRLYKFVKFDDLDDGDPLLTPYRSTIRYDWF